MSIRTVLSTMLSVACVAGMGYTAYAETVSLKQAQAQEEYKEQHYCMSLNLYHEARSESALGQKAVGFVTLNRVQSNRYPDTICDVVYQAKRDSNGNPIRNKCQYSWFCDGKSDKPRDKESWEVAKQIAHEVMQSYGITEDVTGGATMYHASYVSPYWKSSYEKTVRIDTHVFYK